MSGSEQFMAAVISAMPQTPGFPLVHGRKTLRAFQPKEHRLRDAGFELSWRESCKRGELRHKCHEQWR